MAYSQPIRSFLLALLVLMPIPILLPPIEGLEVRLDTSLAHSSASFWGEAVGDASSFAVSIAGDVNGDGFDDILIGAHKSGQDVGRAYLVLGKASGWEMDANLSNADASFCGEEVGDQAGIAVSGAGDVNGDGLDDLLIGATGADDGADYHAGKTYLMLGKASGWALDTDLSDADASFWGEGRLDNAGSTVSGAGDVNGDGFDDFLIGAADNDDGGSGAGKAYLIMGRASGWARDVPLSNADASFIGAGKENAAGISVAGAGDVNGDGLDDLLIGAPGVGETLEARGATYLILGKETGWLTDGSLLNADASIIGAGLSEVSGFEVAGAGDVNGDGFCDILIGASCSREGGGEDVGQTYLILGKAKGWSMGMTLSTASASFIGEAERDSSGFSVSGAGDVDGDGFDDLLIGSPGNDEGGDGAGQAYLVMGRASGWSMDTDLSDANASFLGEGPGDGAGIAVSGGGDVDGDGFDDTLIGAHRSDDGGQDAGQAYLVFPDRNIQPTTVSSVGLYSDDACTKPASWAYMNETVYVRVTGAGGNISRADVTEVVVASSRTSPWGFRLRLHETGVDSGIFEGSFRLATRTHDQNGWIGTRGGETVTVTSVVDPSRSGSIGVITRPLISERITHLDVAEDAPFSRTFEVSEGTASSWTFGTNAPWLILDPGSATVLGMPTNQDVSSWWLTVNVTDDNGRGDGIFVVLVVNNTPPRILTGDVTVTDEDSEYIIDYASDDDGQGTITWHLVTDAGWLSIDPATGVLSGTPANDDVGTCHVNVSIDDGNGGWDSRDFTLTVNDAPDAPVLIPPQTPPATEDVPYSLALEALDIDLGDTLTWSMRLTTAGWLRLDSATGVLSGTPTNDDVGDAYLEVIVTDRTGLNASLELIIHVINANDPPEILTPDLTSTLEDEAYRVEYRASDADAGDTLVWTLDTNASWLDLDPSTGILSGLPANDDVGTYRINVIVTDGSDASASHEFMLTVVNVNDPPEITSEMPLQVEALEDEPFSLNLMAEDVDDDDLTWSDDTGLFEISPAGGTISFVPTQSEVGEWWVNITVEDGAGLTDVVTMRLVVVNVNDPPVIAGMLPASGSEHKKGESIAFSVEASDEDGDELTITWKEGDRVLGIGSPLEYSKLGKGEHTITVVVADGTGTAEQSLVVIVKGVEESPGAGIVIIVLSMMLAALVVASRRRI